MFTIVQDLDHYYICPVDRIKELEIYFYEMDEYHDRLNGNGYPRKHADEISEPAPPDFVIE